MGQVEVARVGVVSRGVKQLPEQKLTLTGVLGRENQHNERQGTRRTMAIPSKNPMLLSSKQELETESKTNTSERTETDYGQTQTHQIVEEQQPRGLGGRAEHALADATDGYIACNNNKIRNRNWPRRRNRTKKLRARVTQKKRIYGEY